MSGLLWILIGLGAGLVALGLYYFNSTRRAERAPFPLDDGVRDALGADPLDDPLAQPPARAPQEPRLDPKMPAKLEPRIETSSEFDEFGVSPVRLRPQDETAAARLVAGRQRRAPRFSYKNASDDAPTTMDARREPHFDAGFSVENAEHRTASTLVTSHEARPRPHTEPAPQAVSKPIQASTPQTDAQSTTPDVIPLYLVARKPGGFAGSALLPLFARLGFEFGEMDVYHYTDANGQILFSLMNGVAPGTFNPSTLSEHSTPALALFLRLPIARQPNLVLEQFLDLAYHMADALDASVLDDRREELNTESVDRMRAIFIDD